jgi:predicted molibdopterin-dependent oxidoreductase YjgC
LQPSGQLSVLAAICKFVIGTHEGLQDELTEVFIETTTKQLNDWLQALELALREVEAPDWLARFVVSSGAFLLWGKDESP